MGLLKIDLKKKITQVGSDYVYNYGVLAVEAAKEIVKIKKDNM